MGKHHTPVPHDCRQRLGHRVPLALALLVSVAVSTPAPTTFESLRVGPEREGITRVEVVTDNPDVPYSYRQHEDADGQARGVLRLRNVVEPDGPTAVQVWDCNLQEVRIGHHSELSPPELHVVFDLAGEDVSVLSISRHNGTLVLQLGRREATRAPEHPSPHQVRNVAPTVTRTPTPTPSPPVTPTLPPPTPTRARTATDRPSAAPSPTPARPRALYRQRELHDTAALSPGATATALAEVTVSRRRDGSTLLRVTADQPFQRHAVLDFADPRDPARHVLVLLGVRTTELPPLLGVDDPCLQAVQVANAAEGRPPETQLGLVLTSSHVTEIAIQGRHLVVVITPETGREP